MDPKRVRLAWRIINAAPSMEESTFSENLHRDTDIYRHTDTEKQKKRKEKEKEVLGV